MLYFSWTFFRAFYSDYFGLFALDLLKNRQWSLQKICRFDSTQPPHDGMRLSKSGRSFSLLSEMCEGQGHLRLSTKRLGVELVIRPSNVPRFSKNENQFVRHYGFEHRYKNPVSGVVTLDGIAYPVNSDYSYQDHCFGNVPRRTGWHWIALQNDAIALTSLVNYGPYGQRYSQVYDGKDWVRLDQDVAFEQDRGNSGGVWRITSTDMDLKLTARGMTRKITRIPPLLPVLVKVDHTEFLVEAAGRVRINGSWQTVRQLVGVMEEHHGRW